MAKCYVGSQNPTKVAAVKEVFADHQVIGMKVKSGVSKQPKDDEETIKGALNRAMGLPTDGLRIGLEAGIAIHGEMLFLVNWGVLIDRCNNIFYAGGTRIPLPSFMKKELLVNNLELSQLMQDFLQVEKINEKEGSIGYLTSSVVKRVDIFTHIVKLLYGQYLKKEEK